MKGLEKYMIDPVDPSLLGEPQETEGLPVHPLKWHEDCL